jgi:integrase
MNERSEQRSSKRPDMRAGRTNPRSDSRTYNEPDLESLPLNPKGWRYVLNLLLHRYNWRHSTKHKGVSNKTMAERGRCLIALFKFLRKNGYKLDPRSLSGRHIDFILAHWQKEAKAGDMAPATIQTYFSFLRTFSGWIGKPKLMKPIGCYFDDPKLYERSYIATTDKSWTAAGVSIAVVILKAIEMDRHVAAALMLMAAFGLRFKEGCMCRPHQDVVQRVSPETGELMPYLDTHRGTKGGRDRYLLIRTAAQREAIEFAKSVATRPNDSVSDRNLNLKQALRRARTVMEKLGITMRDLHVTPHGARHQYAAERYEELTGSAAPVAGGAQIDKTLDHDAPLTVAEELGHGRKQISNSYLGKTTKAKAGPNAHGPVTSSET